MLHLLFAQYNLDELIWGLSFDDITVVLIPEQSVTKCEHHFWTPPYVLQL